MKNKLMLIGMAMVLMTMACGLPSLGRLNPTPTLTPTPDMSWQWFEGGQMRIMLPPTWIERDVTEDMPQILETIKAFFGNDTNFLTDLINDFEGNVAWWGFDGGSPAVYPTRLLVVHNSTFAKLPISMISGMIRMFGGSSADSIESSTVELSDYEMAKFTQLTEKAGWVAYAFKAEGQLWVAIFMTTPANLAAQAEDFKDAMDTIMIEPAN
ncbi:MAG TPA: hypothetical protein PKK82_00280 [Anaerolineaceae bacterium]|nr:hypothetical protein [Chloroflexota bacterium]HNY83265.1 hypothetical protein [Anaerolineaceae bacterium]